jgi:ABC-type multidrug transport system permease subunit
MNDRTQLATPRRYSPVWQLVLARLRELYREPEALFWVYGFPVLLVIALGIAFRNKPEDRIPVDVQVVADGRHTETVALLKEHKEFVVETGDEAACRRRLRTTKTDLVVVPDGEKGYRYLFDSARPEARLARSKVDDVLLRKTLRDAGRTPLIAQVVAAQGIALPSIEAPGFPQVVVALRVASLDAFALLRDDPMPVVNDERTEPGGRYIDFLVPGLLGMSLMGGGLWGVGFAIVDLRIRKVLKRFLATPMRKVDFLTAIMLSRMMFLIPEVIVLLLFAHFAFGVVIQGSLLSLGALILLGAVAFAGIGLLVASRAKTLEAVSGLMNVVMLPMWVLSGIFFSSDRFPDSARPFIKALPLTPLIDSMRAVCQEGATLASQWPQLCIMAAWAVVSFALALWWFRWN